MRREVAAFLAEARHLDLDHFGAEISKHRGAERPRHHPGEIEHAQAGEQMRRKRDHEWSPSVKVRTSLPVVRRSASAARAAGNCAKPKLAPICGVIAPARSSSARRCETRSSMTVSRS